MKIIFFTKYTRMGASSRYRSFQYLPSLHNVTLSTQVSPLFSDAYLTYKYENGDSRIGDVLRAFAARICTVLRVPRASVVFIEYELLPWFPAILERWLALRGCRMVVDYDDALFHQYDSHPNSCVRHLLGQKIATVMRLAHTVLVGNSYLADYARRAGARRVEVIPTVIDLRRYILKATTSNSEPIVIGWIGSPSSARYLKCAAPALARICRNGRAIVRLVGSGAVDLHSVPVHTMPWRECTEVEDIRGFDIGIMPLSDEPWARGKCGFKLIQYMACGLPVVASPVGVNATIVEHGVNGFLATTAEEWEEALSALATDPALRQRMGQAGRAKVEREFCLEVTESRLISLLQNASGGERA